MRIYLLFICLFVFFSSCLDKSKNPFKQTTTSQPKPKELPPATQEGANTFGCLVNGEVWLPYGTLTFGTPSVGCSYYPRVAGLRERLWGYLLINVFHFTDDEWGGFMYVNVYDLYETGRYKLYHNANNTSGDGGGDYVFSASNPKYPQVEAYTEENPNNWIEITRLDSANRIVSGVFQFDLVTDEVEMDTIKVRQGRFDLEFTY